jgi:hypothetical protein
VDVVAAFHLFLHPVDDTSLHEPLKRGLVAAARAFRIAALFSGFGNRPACLVRILSRWSRNLVMSEETA